MPSVQKVHIDKMLTNISIGYKNEQFIADQIFPAVTVNKQSDKYYVYGMERFRTHDDLRAPGTEAHEITWSLSHDQYYTEGHAIRSTIADEEKQNADEEFNLEAEATELVTEAILLNKEVDAANKVMDPNNYRADLKVTLGAGGTFKWSDFMTNADGKCDSNPILDIEKAKAKMHKIAGIRPNVLIMSEQVLNVLKFHPKVIEVIKYVERGVVTKDLLESLFGVKILVGSALHSSTTNPGQVAPGQIENLDYIWGNSAVLAYITPKPGRKQVSMGYTFEWNKDGAGATHVRKWYEVGRRATVVEAEKWYHQTFISNVCAFLFQDCVVPMTSM